MNRGYTGEIQIRVEDTNRYKTPEQEISKIQSKISTRILKIFWIHKKPRVFYPYPGTNQPKYRNNQYENTVHIYCSVRKTQPQKRLKKNLNFFFMCRFVYIFTGILGSGSIKIKNRIRTRRKWPSWRALQIVSVVEGLLRKTTYKTYCSQFLFKQQLLPFQ